MAFLTRNTSAMPGVFGPSPVAAALISGGTAALGESLTAAGHLEQEAPCALQTMAPRPAARTMAFHVLAAPAEPAHLAATAAGEVPDAVCGPYGSSTHGVRCFVTDLRWPDRAIFVDEGLDHPPFDPSSITPLP